MSATTPAMTYAALAQLRRQHPAWRLLQADNAPLVISFLQRSFLDTNLRVMARSELVEKLEDTLYALREDLGVQAFPRTASEYLDDWSADERGWLRKFYPPDSDEPHFDLTPATERAIGWLGSLQTRQFVGTESRLLTVFDLLRQIVQGSDTDPQSRIRDLQRRRADIDAEIARVQAGDIPMLDDTALRDRFQQLSTTARDLLRDFREVEDNFRQLDRDIRERIATWDGSKGELLDDFFGQRDAIAESDQGRSFRAFWTFLMSSNRQDELGDLMERAMALPAVRTLMPDARMRRVHYDWLEAGEHTQRTIAQLSQQLRKYLDEKTWLENRRIMELIHGIEAKALAARTQPPPNADLMELPYLAPQIELPMERPLFSPPVRPVFTAKAETGEADDITADALYKQVMIDRGVLQRQIDATLARAESQGLTAAQVTLAEVIAAHPLQQGLAELVAYLAMAGDSPNASFDDSMMDLVHWQESAASAPAMRRASQIPRVIFTRSTSPAAKTQGAAHNADPEFPTNF